MEFQEIAQNDSGAIARLSAVAIEIIKEHYDPIIGSAMNDYMIGMFQSVPAITHQLEEGYRYWFVKADGAILGFLAYQLRDDTLYLSKFYLYKHRRGKGYVHQMLDFLIQIAKENRLKAIELNVNRNNPSVQTYKKLGFSIIRGEKNPIGKGYVMDDYVLALDLV
ncbi:MAG: GNAT family N-acetyltransferase [Oxalobacter sp.]|nr:GNAT family N-acetyltransferase [Oxalobacter sp.]